MCIIDSRFIIDIYYLASFMHPCLLVTNNIQFLQIIQRTRAVQGFQRNQIYPIARILEENDDHSSVQFWKPTPHCDPHTVCKFRKACSISCIWIAHPAQYPPRYWTEGSLLSLLPIFIQYRNQLYSTVIAYDYFQLNDEMRRCLKFSSDRLSEKELSKLAWWYRKP